MAGNKNSGRKWQLTAGRREQITKLAASGCTTRVVGELMGIPERTWRNYCHDNPEIEQAMTEARVNAKDAMLNRLLEIAADNEHPHQQKTLLELLKRLDRVDTQIDNANNIERNALIKAQAILLASQPKAADGSLIGEAFVINELKPALRGENDEILNQQDYVGLLRLEDDE